MAVLELILLLLQFEVGIDGGNIHLLYHRPGENVVLPCISGLVSVPCSNVDWLHYADGSTNTQLEVVGGKVVQRSGRAARLVVNHDCSLIINTITAEDAGRYTCKLWDGASFDTDVFLFVLSILPDADQTNDGNVTLQCSPWKNHEYVPCSEDNIYWVDEAGAELLGVGSKIGPNTCASNLTINLQQGSNRRYTCQIFYFNKVRTEAYYPPVSQAGIRGGSIHLQFSKSGDDVVLSCNNDLDSFDCSTVKWFYYKEFPNAKLEIENGKVVQSSGRAARLSVDSRCSLIINNITAEDAGRYACQFGNGGSFDTDVYLFILTMSPPPPGPDPTKERDVTLQCSLARYSSSGRCPENSIRWVDETGTELLGEDVGHKVGGQTNCVSSLTVKLRKGTNRRYTCQIVIQTKVRIDADYTAYLPAVDPISDLKVFEVAPESMRVTWNASTDDVSGYRVEMIPMITGSKNQDLYVASSQTSVVVRDLSPDTEYQVNVFALKDLMSSDPVMVKTKPVEVSLKCSPGVYMKADVVLLIDGSYSIGLQNFAKVRLFLEVLVNTFDIGLNKVQIALAQYSRVPHVEFYLNTHQDINAMVKAVRSFPYRGGSANTGKAMMYVREVIFQTNRGARANVPRVIILITDGKSADAFKEPATKLRNDSVEIFAVGVKDAVQGELEAIASAPAETHVYMIEDFDAFQRIFRKLKQSICLRIKQELCRIYQGQHLQPKALNFSDVRSRSFRASWEIDANNVDVFLIQFEAEEAADGRHVSMYVPGNTFAALLPHLTPLTRYEVKVSAQYGKWESLPVTGYETTLEEVSPPTNLVTGDVTDTSFRATWTAAPRNVQTYRVQWKSLFSEERGMKTVPGDVTSTVLKGLTPEMRYQVSVIAIYGYKDSDPLTGLVTTDGNIGRGTYLYHRAGDDVVLPCNSTSSHPCFNSDWSYNGDINMRPENKIQSAAIDQSSAQHARLNVDNKCSLVIHNITTEDAGLYICQSEDKDSLDADVYLSILSISSFPSVADPAEDENVMLQCSLWRYSALGPCTNNSIVWTDETGTKLLGEGVGYKAGEEMNCVSSLTVKHQSGHSRRYTCQFIEENRVKIEAHYPPVSTGDLLSKSTITFHTWSQSSVMLALRVTGLILMLGITGAVIRCTRGKRAPKDIKVRFVARDNTVNYENPEDHSAAAELI